MLLRASSSESSSHSIADTESRARMHMESKMFCRQIYEKLRRRTWEKTKDWPLREVVYEWTKLQTLNLVTTKKSERPPWEYSDALQLDRMTFSPSYMSGSAPRSGPVFFPSVQIFFYPGAFKSFRGVRRESRAAEAAAPAGAQRASSLREFYPILLSFLLPSNVIWKVEFRWLLSFSGITFHETMATWRNVCHSSQLVSVFCRFGLRFLSRLITLCSAE